MFLHMPTIPSGGLVLHRINDREDTLQARAKVTDWNRERHLRLVTNRERQHRSSGRTKGIVQDDGGRALPTTSA